MTAEPDFYIGWANAAPPSLARFLRARVLALLVGVVALGALLAATQATFAPARFEFGVLRSFEGRLDHVPYPTLVVARPGADGDTRSSRWLLTVFGKRGADAVTLPLDGHRVRFDGSLIYRDGATMVELDPATLTDLGRASGEEARGVEGEPIELDGEIVDSKCFLGVMKPGNLKPHRACAARCISGGVPPVLLVRDAEGRATYYLLVDENGGAVNQRVLHLVAEHVSIRGRVSELDGLRILRANPATYARR